MEAPAFSRALVQSQTWKGPRHLLPQLLPWPARARWEPSCDTSEPGRPGPGRGRGLDRPSERKGRPGELRRHSCYPGSPPAYRTEAGEAACGGWAEDFVLAGGSRAHRWPPAPRACIELLVWVGLVAARGPRKSRREGVGVLPELFHFGSKRRLALRPLPPVAVSLHCEMKCLSFTSPHPKGGTRSLPTSPSHLPSVPLPPSGSLVSRGIMQTSPLPCFPLPPRLPNTAPSPPPHHAQNQNF